jgi:hypothetical protein
MLRCVALVRTGVSEELRAFFIRVTTIGELGTTLAITSNRCMLRWNSHRRENLKSYMMHRQFPAWTLQLPCLEAHYRVALVDELEVGLWLEGGEEQDRVLGQLVATTFTMVATTFTTTCFQGHNDASIFINFLSCGRGLLSGILPFLHPVIASQCREMCVQGLPISFQRY